MRLRSRVVKSADPELMMITEHLSLSILLRDIMLTLTILYFLITLILNLVKSAVFKL